MFGILCLTVVLKTRKDSSLVGVGFYPVLFSLSHIYVKVPHLGAFS